MITWQPEHDTDGVPTHTRRIEVDPREWPGWRVVLFRLLFAASLIVLGVGVVGWMLRTPWALAAWVLSGCCVMGLAMEDDSGTGGEDD